MKTISSHLLDDRPREECGLVGITGTSHAAEWTFLGLYALQHRGQESAGICSVHQGVARVRKGSGLVSEVFDGDNLGQLGGRTAVGHVRYSTAGGSLRENAQPILVRYAEGDLSVSHNGNLTNAQLLRRRLVAEGAIFQGSGDSEVIVHLVARSRAPTVEAQLRDALGQLEGSFSLVISVGSTIYAIRDPRGFRPLVLGRRESAHIVASETCALDIMDAEYIRDVKPGEVLRIGEAGIESLPSLDPVGEQSACIFELTYFARPDSRIFGVGVDRARRAFGRRLAREHPVRADAVVAVPDSANSAALGYSEESGIPFELGLLRNHYIGRTFIQPRQSDRDFGARIKYNPVREILEGRKVVVVDDSLVRGTTSRSLVRFIRGAGAKEVHFRIASPPVRFPCFYGIDMPSREELLGAQLSVDEIRDELRADSLGYLSLEGMTGAVEEFGPFCDACFSGDYQAPLVDIEEGLLPASSAPRC